MYGWYDTVKLYEMYAKNKKAYRKNKDIVLLQTMREIDRYVKEATLDASFMKEYKSYKLSSFIFSSVWPSVFFGLVTGCLCTVLSDYMIVFVGSQLLTILLIILCGVFLFGALVMYFVIGRHTYNNILVPYAIKEMEEKIEAHITAAENPQHASEKYKVIVIRHRKTGKKAKTNNGTKST